MLQSQVKLYLVHENNKEVQEVYCHYSQDMHFLERYLWPNCRSQ